MFRTEKSKSIGNFNQLKQESEIKDKEGTPKQEKDVYMLRPVVGSGISYLWDRLFDSKHINADAKKEINDIFQKIQAEIQGILHIKLEKLKFDAKLLAEKQSNQNLQAKLDQLSQEFEEERNINIKLSQELAKFKQGENNSQESTKPDFETKDMSNEDFIKESYFFEDRSKTISPIIQQLKSEINQKENVMKELDDTLLVIEKELKELSGYSPFITISSFSTSEEKEKNTNNPSVHNCFHSIDAISQFEHNEAKLHQHHEEIKSKSPIVPFGKRAFDRIELNLNKYRRSYSDIREE